MKVNKLITHNGSFHTDDIFSAALLFLLLEKRGESSEIVRTRDEAFITAGDYVFDVGGTYDKDKNRFDHHQAGGAKKRENGIEYSSFGLVWEKFGAEICKSRKAADLIEKKLVMSIDAFDNGFDLVENKHDVTPYFIQHVFFAMEPTWREENESHAKMDDVRNGASLSKDEAFLKCVEMAKIILWREIIQAEDIVIAEELLTKVYENTKDKRIIVLEQNYPFEYILHNFPEPLFAIYPRKIDGSWGVKAIREDPKTFVNRKNFPKSWGGLRDEELQKISKVPDALFCHRGLFLAAAQSKEGAIKLAQLALNS